MYFDPMYNGRCTVRFCKYRRARVYVCINGQVRHAGTMRCSDKLKASDCIGQNQNGRPPGFMKSFGPYEDITLHCNNRKEQFDIPNV
jgi:hypothetical protein